MIGFWAVIIEVKHKSGIPTPFSFIFIYIPFDARVPACDMSEKRMNVYHISSFCFLYEILRGWENITLCDLHNFFALFINRFIKA